MSHFGHWKAATVDADVHAGGEHKLVYVCMYVCMYVCCESSCVNALLRGNVLASIIVCVFAALENWNSILVDHRGFCC